MKLIIGGYAQGKFKYAQKKFQVENKNVYDGKIPDGTGNINGTLIINNLNTYIRQSMIDGTFSEKLIFDFIDKYPDCVIITDEVGNGIVPIDEFERGFRETIGRIQIELAKMAEEVERVICGIGQKIK